MPNVNDYLDWRGDLPINTKIKFNEVDSLILARFSYLIFNKIEMMSEETVQSISIKMKDFDNEEFRYNGDKDLITKLGTSERFKDMIVTDFVETSEKEIEKQFGAITIHISDKEMYISYIGTDSTINGWKEDFNMSFMDSVPCQIAGKNYLEKIAKKYPDKKIRIGGHSKGGNVAIYSAITVCNEIQKRIIKVCNYDGPGFNKKIIENIANKNIISKIETYIPQDSVIGRVLEHKEKCEVVLSDQKGLLQHDIYSWQVIKDSLIRSDSVTGASNLINKTISEWIENTTPEHRKIFMDGIFELFYATNANTFGDISKNLTSNIVTILKTYKGISEEDRKTITEMLKLFGRTYFFAVKETETNKFINIKERYIFEGKKFFREKK